MEYLWKPQVVCHQWFELAPVVVWRYYCPSCLTPSLGSGPSDAYTFDSYFPGPRNKIASWPIILNCLFFFSLVLVFALKFLPCAESQPSLRLWYHLHLHLSLTLLMSTAEDHDRWTFLPSVCVGFLGAWAGALKQLFTCSLCFLTRLPETGKPDPRWCKRAKDMCFGLSVTWGFVWNCTG